MPLVQPILEGGGATWLCQAFQRQEHCDACDKAVLCAALVCRLGLRWGDSLCMGAPPSEGMSHDTNFDATCIGVAGLWSAIARCQMCLISPRSAITCFFHDVFGAPSIATCRSCANGGSVGSQSPIDGWVLSSTIASPKCHRQCFTRLGLLSAPILVDRSVVGLPSSCLCLSAQGYFHTPALVGSRLCQGQNSTRAKVGARQDM